MAYFEREEREVDGAWNALRTTLRNNFRFHDIKEIVGLAGLDLTQIVHIENKPIGRATKGQLMSGIDGVMKDFNEESKKRFIAVVTEEILNRQPDTRQALQDNLSRLGWTLCDNAVIPVEILDVSTLFELPSESQADLTKAAQRLRDGDLSGAISSACGALDAVTSAIYSSARLGDPTKDSFQQRCKRSLDARGVLPKMEQELRELGWVGNDIKTFRENFKGAMNQEGKCEFTWMY